MAQSNAAPRQTCAFPSSLPPQLVISWLPVREVASALLVTSSWRGASEAVFQSIAQSRGLGRFRADVPWREVVRCSKRRVAVLYPGKRYSGPDAAPFARLLGVLDQGWVARPVTFPPTGAPDVGDVGDLISECACERHYGNGHIQIIAFRADRDGMIHMMERRGVLIGFPGELGTVNLTAADVETLGVSDLKKELAARGVTTTAAPTTGPELQDLRKRLIDELRAPGFFGWVYP